jgi:hypothetical protein
MNNHLTSRAQRFIEEFELGSTTRHGIANVLEHLAEAWDGERIIPVSLLHAISELHAISDELTAPTLLDRALAGDKDAARQFLYEAGFIDEDGNLHPRYSSEAP